MADIYDLLTGTGCTSERATAFSAGHAARRDGGDAGAGAPRALHGAGGLTSCAFGDKGISAASGAAPAAG